MTTRKTDAMLDELLLKNATIARLDLANQRLRDENRQLGEDYLTLTDLVSAHQCHQDARTATNSPGSVLGDTPTSHDPREAHL